LDILLGIIAATLLLLSLFFAAAMDVKKGEVSNLIWIPALGALPLALFRILAAGLLLLYALQAILVFALMLLCFDVGLLGGADGKAIVVISLIYPWLEIEYMFLSIGPLAVYLGALAIGGIESLGLAFLNLDEWCRSPLLQRQMSRPEKRRFWFTRRLSRSGEARKPPVWKNVAVPFVLYVLIAYVFLLVYSVVI
jgi:Flp pilus assembly protein protease CpaA